MAIVKQKFLAFGGAEKVINEAIKAFYANQAIELSILARSWSLPPEIATGQNCRVIRCNPFFLGGAMRSRSFVRAVSRQLPNFDLVQAHEPIPGAHIYRAGSGLHAQWLKQVAHGRTARQRHQLFQEPKHQAVLQLEREMFAHPSLRAVIANSQMVVDDLAELYPNFDKERVHLIWNGVDHQRFSPERRSALCQESRDNLGIPANSQVLLILGSGWHRKGLSTALEFMALLPESVILLIAGKESHPKRFRSAAESLGIGKDRLRWIGPTSNPIQLFAAADVFVQPSMYDQMPNASLEAMACGLPVVVSRTSGTRDLIDEGGEGFVRDWHEAPDWVEPILHALEYSESMGQASYRRVLPLTFERMLVEWLALYKELLPSSFSS
ncbi:glycosyltransferase family 4 protein [Cyanobium sp. HWJ4-Hawea]|nr:glycosyltransferase family 4 protein [Cyanobium sp. HWJ4-Hawea]